MVSFSPMPHTFSCPMGKVSSLLLALGMSSWPSLFHEVTLYFIVPYIQDINNSQGEMIPKLYRFVCREL